VGCRLNVDDDWWPENPGGSGSNPGVIHHVDFSQSRARYFVVELDDEQGDFHPMPYNDVFRYADENQQGFSRFRLPQHALPSPDGEQVHVPRRRGRSQRTNDDGDTDDDTATTASMTDFSSDGGSGNESGSIVSMSTPVGRL